MRHSSTGDRPALRPQAREVDRWHEDTILFGLLAALGAFRVVIGLAADETFGSEGTIAWTFLLIGIVGLLRRG